MLEMALSRGTRLGLGALLAATVVACSSGGSGKGAATAASSSPHAAVTKLLDDLSSHQFGNVIDDLAPGEADALRAPLNSLVVQLDRLQILKPGTTLDNISGVSLAFVNPVMQVSQVAAGIDVVHFTGGTVNTSVTPSQLPLGQGVTSLTPTLPPAKSTSKSLGTPGSTGLATIEVNGRWYVSLGYTIAESELQESGRSAVPGSPLPSAGDGSPNSAVTDLIDSAVNLDFSHLLALTPPDEIPAARAYSSLYLSKAGSASSRAQRAGYSATVSNLQFSDVAVAGGTMVVVKSITVSGQIGGKQFTYKNGCATVEGVSICRSNLGQLLGDASVPATYRDLAGIVNGLRPRLGFVTVEEGGEWYVSPTRTFIDDSTAILAVVSNSQFRAIVNDVQKLELG